MPDDSEEKRAWVARVLRVTLPGPGNAPSAANGAALLQLWVAAREQVDDAIASLQSALKADGDPDLQQIAEYGLHGVTRNQNVQMMAALREMAAGTPAGPKKLTVAVEDFRELLASPVADLLEDNPFGVPVPLRAVLGPALDTLAASLG